MSTCAHRVVRTTFGVCVKSKLLAEWHVHQMLKCYCILCKVGLGPVDGISGTSSEQLPLLRDLG
eukprot:1703878-Amphidinium_carterae.1